MLQIQVLRQQTAWVKERLAVKNFAGMGLVDEILEMDEAIRQLKIDTETSQAAQNAAAKKIGSFMAAGDKEAAELISKRWQN